MKVSNKLYIYYIYLAFESKIIACLTVDCNTWEYWDNWINIDCIILVKILKKYQQQNYIMLNNINYISKHLIIKYILHKYAV